MAKMCKNLFLLAVIFLAGSAWGVRSVIISGFPSSPVATSRDSSQKLFERSAEVKQNVQDDKTQKTEPGCNCVTFVRNGKNNAERFHPLKDFGLSEMLESLLQPLFRDDVNKKPKLKTVVSLTEVISPKHQACSPFHLEPLVSPFGVKEIGLSDDPFFDFKKILSSMPKFGKIDFVWPLRHKRSDGINNNTDLELHHSFKRDSDFMNSKIENQEDKCQNGPSLFIKETNSGESPIVSLGEIKLDEVVTNAEDNGKYNGCGIIKTLPYIEGAIGGIMFVMLILLIASWKIKKPNCAWARVPFIDKSQYIEKV